MSKIYLNGSLYSAKLNNVSYSFERTIIQKPKWFNITDLNWDNGEGSITGHISFYDTEQQADQEIWNLIDRGILFIGLERDYAHVKHHKRDDRPYMKKRYRANHENWYRITDGEVDFSFNIPTVSDVRKPAADNGNTKAFMHVRLALIVNPLGWHSTNKVIARFESHTYEYDI